MQAALDQLVLVKHANLVSNYRIKNVFALQKLSYQLQVYNVSLALINAIFALIIILALVVNLATNIKQVKDVF